MGIILRFYQYRSHKSAVVLRCKPTSTKQPGLHPVQWLALICTQFILVKNRNQPPSVLNSQLNLMEGGWLEVLLSEVLWVMKTSAIQPNHQKTFINPEVILTLPVKLWQNKLGRTGENNSAQQLQSRCFDHKCWSTWPNGAVMCLRPTQLVLFA